MRWLANYKNMGQSQLNPYLNVCLVHKFKMQNDLTSHRKEKNKRAPTFKESYTKQYLVIKIKGSDRGDSYYHVDHTSELEQGGRV